MQLLLLLLILRSPSEFSCRFESFQKARVPCGMHRGGIWGPTSEKLQHACYTVSGSVLKNGSPRIARSLSSLALDSLGTSSLSTAPQEAKIRCFSVSVPLLDFDFSSPGLPIRWTSTGGKISSPNHHARKMALLP